MANDFTGDSSCKALWRFEEGAINEDSIGGNDFYFDYPLEIPQEDTTVYNEGACSAKCEAYDLDPFEADEGYELDAGFPCQSGSAEKKFSFAAWVRLDASPKAYQLDYNNALFTKFRTFECFIAQDNPYEDDGIHLIVYRSSTLWEQFSILEEIPRGTWLHIGVAIDGDNQTYLIRYFDGNSVQTKSGALTGTLYLSDRTFEVGDGLTGNLDEAVVFGEVKTADDFDSIRAGTFGGVPANSYTQWGWVDYAPVRTYVHIPVMEHGWVDYAPSVLSIEVDLQAWKMIPPATRWALPANQPRREVFICTLRKTGLDDVDVPLASLQMRRRDGNPTMISCVIPDAETYMGYVEDREDGEIIIYAGSITEDGTRHLSELDRVSLDSISYDIGVQSSSLVISGYRTETNINPRPLDITDVTYYGLQADGKRRIRAKINQFLRPGDTAIYNGESFVVDQIYLYIEPRNAWMEAAGT
jgi:hypothetical protein